jgi:hypothetical protein
LGTGFVPNAPEQTAAMIAGSHAQSAAQAAMERAASQSSQGDQPGSESGQSSSEKQSPQEQGSEGSQAQQSGEGQGKGQGRQQSGEGQGQGRQKSDRPGKPSPNAKQGGTTQAGSTSSNQRASDSPLEQVEGLEKGIDGRTDNGGNDAEAAARKFAKEPWFTRLPPELRKAIRANSQRRAPRGYEERMNRYFENVD